MRGLSETLGGVPLDSDLPKNGHSLCREDWAMRIDTDMTWAIPIFVLFAIAFLVLNIQAIVTIYCIRKREKGLRAGNWLEFLAGYDAEQRKSDAAASSLEGKNTG